MRKYLQMSMNWFITHVQNNFGLDGTAVALRIPLFVAWEIPWSSITYCKLYELNGVSETSAQILKPTSHRCPLITLPGSRTLSIHCLSLNLRQYPAITSIGSRPSTVQLRTLSAENYGSIAQYTKIVSRAIFNRRFKTITKS